MTRSGAVSLEALLEALKNVPEFPTIWMNPLNGEDRSGERLVISLDFYEKLERDFYRSDEEYDMYADLSTANNGAARLSSFEYYLSMHLGECSEVWVRRGGRSLIPSNDSEKFLYTGPARGPITEVPLTPDLLNQIISGLKEKAHKFWRGRAEDRTLHMGDGSSVKLQFPQYVSMENRKLHEDKLREMYQGGLSSLPTLSC